MKQRPSMTGAVAIHPELSKPPRHLPIQKSGIWLILITLLNACWAPTLKPPAAELGKLRSLLIVPVESPPLEVFPDPLEHRIPAYRHYQNMAMPVALRTNRYRNAAGIVIAGLISQDDTQNTPIEQDDTAPRMALAAETEPEWTPARAMAQLAQAWLAARQVNASLGRDFYPLPMAAGERNANLNHWHDAIQVWYALDLSPADYRLTGNADAVLEVGIGGYRIFEGQTSLQLLLKLINPATHRVIARARAETFMVDDAALASLDSDSLAFKRRIAEMGTRLLNQALSDIGWPEASTPEPVAAR
ncbi:hypothetical protein IVG45_11810 [Methylomonas sp. LL1]|uniref:hypothetical protein n=1 Tax=Methylomonas sp. LL1 TaxID=2785785 RepID=UPI0018C41DD9|nr:hypothetical protein [Methylomonas sp. LL1]QPK61577.1 hypothetical protein IVG45_11810 [Methylomonas sp. LL1]